MSHKRVAQLESVILVVEGKLNRKKTDSLPTWSVVKAGFELKLREHMWDILVMNAEHNMSQNTNVFTKHDECLCTWICTLFTNMSKVLQHEKVMVLKITEDDPMPWWNNQEKIDELLLKRKNQKSAIGKNQKQQESSHREASKNIANIVSETLDDSASISQQHEASNGSTTVAVIAPSTVAVIAPSTKKQDNVPHNSASGSHNTGNNGKRSRDHLDDDKDYDGYDDYADVCIASMKEIFEFAKMQQTNNPQQPNVLSRQALQVEQFRAQKILKALQTGKHDFSFDDRRSMLISLIRKSKHEAERLHTEEKLNAFNCVLEASEINL